MPTTYDNINWGSPSALRIAGNLAIGMWVKLPSNAQGCLIKFGVVAGLDPTTAWPYFLSITGTPGAWNLIVGHDAGTNINNASEPFQTSLPNDAWTYVGISRDTSAKTYKCYVSNGVAITLIGTFSYASNPPSTAGSAAGSTCTVGMPSDYRSDLGLVHLIATVQQIYVAGRAWSSDDHLLASKASPPSASLKLVCPMGRTPEVDTSGNGETGTVTGTVLVQGH